MIDFDPDTVSKLLRDTAREFVLPRFRALSSDEVLEKSPGDLVTLADVESEQNLSPELEAILPGSSVVGEEACHQNKDRFNLLRDQELVWLVDPVDGTNNFASGSETFCMMVALVYKKKTVRSWIYLPINDEVYSAEAGAGAMCEGEKLVMPDRPDPSSFLGQVNMGLFHHDDRHTVRDLFSAHFGVRNRLRCAGQDFVLQIQGIRHYSLYRKLWPWDHAPGALLLQEAGGRYGRMDGLPYDPTRREYGLLSAADPSLWNDIHDKINPYCLAA